MRSVLLVTFREEARDHKLLHNAWHAWSMLLKAEAEEANDPEEQKGEAEEQVE